MTSATTDGAARGADGAARSVEITWFGQAGFRLAAGEDRVLVDAFLSPHAGRSYPPAASATELADSTVALCTHEHDDHLDLVFLRDLLATGCRPSIVVPAPVVPIALAGGLDSELVVGAAPGSPLGLGGITVHPVASEHGVGGDEPVEYGFSHSGDPRGGFAYLGYVVEIGGVRIYHAGDTLVHPGLAPALRQLAPDVLLLPINGRDFVRESAGCVGNMNEDEAAWLSAEVAPSYVIPMHYEGFANNLGDVGRFARQLNADSPTALLMLPRGRGFTVTL